MHSNFEKKKKRYARGGKKVHLFFLVQKKLRLQEYFFTGNSKKLGLLK